MFGKILHQLKPQLTQAESNLLMANGDTSSFQGEACFKGVKTFRFWPQTAVANIEVLIIIGYDFLFAQNCSPYIGNSSLKLGRKYIKNNIESQNESLLQMLDRNVAESSGAEMIIGGKIDTDRNPRDDSWTQNGKYLAQKRHFSCKSPDYPKFTQNSTSSNELNNPAPVALLTLHSCNCRERVCYFLRIKCQDLSPSFPPFYSCPQFS